MMFGRLGVLNTFSIYDILNLMLGLLECYTIVKSRRTCTVMLAIW